MNVGICDFPSTYSFPPHGYGGIERWLWAVAVGAHRAGAQVHLIGPAWRADLPGISSRLPVRLEALGPGTEQARSLAKLGLDLLVVGHEYPSLPAWRATWSELDCRVVTFQHDPSFRHRPDAFDGQRSRLFCYSPEMVSRYAAHQPKQTLSVQFGLDEHQPPGAERGEGLVWLGRIDAQKAPHLAILAAARLGQRIRIIGPVLDRIYVERHAHLLNAAHVELVGEVAGHAKLTELARGRVLVYTCATDYIEAGAAVFGESLRCGTPVAALAWRPGTCAQVALCPDTGVVADVDPVLSEDQVVEQFTEAIAAAERLDAATVQTAGLRRFDAERHFRALL